MVNHFSNKKEINIIYNQFVIVVIVFIIILFNHSFSSEMSDNFYKSKGPLEYYVDVFQSSGIVGKSRLEVCYSLDLSQLAVLSKDTLHLISLKIQMIVTDESGNELGAIRYNKDFSLADSEFTSAPLKFIDIKEFLLSPGLVYLNISIGDSISGKKGKINTTLDIRDYKNNLSLSDIYIVEKIKKGSKASVFNKSGILIVPNPSRKFILNEPFNLYFYFEINNLSFAEARPSYYIIYFSISDLQGHLISEVTSEPKSISATQSARIEKFSTQGFKTGAYRLKLIIEDLESNQQTKMDRVFFISDPTAKMIDVLPMSDQDAQKYFDQIRYIAGNVEKEVYWQLDSNAKQIFLINFWKQRDPNPATVENEFMQEHFARIHYIEKNFRGGLNSDMGRVFLIYGEPIEIDRKIFNSAYDKSVEIWYYVLEGDNRFVFVDRLGDGVFTLVHSDYRDEIQNPDWENDIKSRIISDP